MYSYSKCDAYMYLHVDIQGGGQNGQGQHFKRPEGFELILLQTRDLVLNIVSTLFGARFY